MAVTRLVLAATMLVVGIAAVPASEGAITDACRGTAIPQQGCDVVRAGSYVAGDLCADLTARADDCATFNGQPVGDEEIAAYRQSATHRHLSLQRELQADLPLRDAVFVATHNSYNSLAYDPSLSRSDANQTYSISQQLDMDVRRIELDVHWWYGSDGQRAPVTCHATGEPAGYVDTPVTRHTGCTTEDTVDVALGEIARWLVDNPGEVIMVRFENHLEGTEGHDVLAAEVESTVGELVYRPAGSGCATLPLDLTVNDVRRAGKQILVIGGCGEGSAAWQALSFDDDALRRESTYRGEDFDYPTCGGIPRRSQDQVSFATHWIRRYEDATVLSSVSSFPGTPPQRVTPEVAAGWTRCGVNQPSFDHLTVTDGRLDALVWTFDGDDDLSGDNCAAAESASGRLTTSGCTTHRLPFVCRQGTTYAVTRARGPWHAGPETCASEGLGQVATPRTGYEAMLVRDALTATETSHAWTSLRYVNGRWRTDCVAGGGTNATVRPTQGPPLQCG